jgi:PAS domain S-box-containing protein
VTDLTNRTRAELALRESEVKFRDFAESASDWFWEIGVEFQFTFLTENAFGSNAAARIGTTCWDHALDLETDSEKWQLVWETLRLRKPFRDFVYRTLGADGSPMHVKAAGKPIFDSNGDFCGYRGTGTDVTASIREQEERRRTEQNLQKWQAYLAASQRLTHTGSWAFNTKTGKAVYWSDEMYRIYGRDPLQDGLPTYDELFRYVHPDDRDDFKKASETRRGGSAISLDYRIVTADGTVKQVHSARLPISEKAGTATEIVGTLVDVTERRRSEHRVIVQQRITRILAEAATVEEAMPRILQAVCEPPGWDIGMFWSVDRDHGVLRCAAWWCKPSVRTPRFEAASKAHVCKQGSGLPGKVWARRAPVFVPNVADDPEIHIMHIAAQEGMHAACGFPILLGNEVLGVIEFISREPREPLSDLMVIVGGQMGQFIDRKRAENALQLAQAELAHVTRVMTMSELTASIAHEVNQPLGAIVTSAGAGERWLAAMPPQIEKAKRALKRIVNDGKRASEVIKRMHALMKRQAPRKDWLDINETSREVVGFAQYEMRRRDVRLELRLGRDIPPVRGDRVQLQQVLVNLVMNAIEAMSGITERTRELTIVSTSDGPDTVCVEVRDSGTGLDPAQAPHLFEPFYTTKAEGLGVGLAISRSIIEAHGGQLSATVNAPYGMVFRISLPVNEGPA